MTRQEIFAFYSEDEHLYDLINNDNFMYWFSETMEKDYNKVSNIEDVQELIDFITIWYNIKYPERELKRVDGDYMRSYSVVPQPLSRFMDMHQLIERIPHDQLCLLECKYKDSVLITRNFPYEEIYTKHGMKMVTSTNYLIHIDKVSGKIIRVQGGELDKYLDPNIETADELYETLESRNDFEYKDLRNCINIHNKDLELRDRLLQLVALKLLYTKGKDSGVNSSRYGYFRANKFINELNEYFNLELNTDEIDEIFNRDYTAEKIDDRTLYQKNGNSETIEEFKSKSKIKEKSIRRFFRKKTAK